MESNTNQAPGVVTGPRPGVTQTEGPRDDRQGTSVPSRRSVTPRFTLSEAAGLLARAGAPTR